MRPSPAVTNCVDPHTYALRARLFASASREDRFTDPVPFRGRFLPSDLQITDQGRLLATAHLELIEPIASLNEADFIPPPNATMIESPGTVKLPDEITKGLLIKQVAPDYPKKAKKSKVQGTVIVHIIIGKDGLPKDAEPISGPPELQEAVIKAVKQWVYKPYLLDGKPVEVDSTITSVFKLGK